MKSCILFSGGPDSLAALEWARKETAVYSLVYFRSSIISSAHRAAMKIASHYAIPLTSIPYASALPKSYTSPLSSDAPYLPDRNLIFLSLLSAWVKTGTIGPNIERIYTGFCLGHPGIYDITSEFVHQLNIVLGLDSSYFLEIKAPYAGVSKTTLLTDLLACKAPIHLTWSCFDESLTVPCGTCLACTRRAEAFKEIGVSDPSLEGS